ncbi:MAG: hypothetical protein WA947_06635 [Phormidesmis sp.]
MSKCSPHGHRAAPGAVNRINGPVACPVWVSAYAVVSQVVAQVAT